MVRNTFTAPEKKIVKKLCRIQLNSLIRITGNGAYLDSMRKLQSQGFNIDESNYEEVFAEMFKRFSKVRRRPNNLYKELDEHNINIIKDILLVFEDQNKPEVKTLWKKLFLSDKLVTNFN